MKPNGKMFAVHMVLFAVCAVCLLSNLSKAETVRGTFKLPITAQWGQMVLAPGEYEFVVDTSSATRIVTVTSKQTGRSSMILASAIDDGRMSAGSELKMVGSEGVTYVKTLCLKDAGVALEFPAPTAMAKLAKAASARMASASGTN